MILMFEMAPTYSAEMPHVLQCKKAIMCLTEKTPVTQSLFRAVGHEFYINKSTTYYTRPLNRNTQNTKVCTALLMKNPLTRGRNVAPYFS